MFRTVSGRPVTAVTATEMRAVDDAAVDAGLGLLQMMENAGRLLARSSHAAASADDPTVLVLAGGGGNGGGGLCAARHLANGGTTVRVVLDRASSDLSGAPERQHRLVGETDVTVSGPAEGCDCLDPKRYDVVVDALVGYGLTDPLRGRTRELVEELGLDTDRASQGAPSVVSLDVPSGVDATSGDTPGVAIRPNRTLTLALPKTGLATARTGGLWLGDIGIPGGVYERASVSYEQPFDGASMVKLRIDGE
jgi:NAD(P)H-hydrate epimerase